jgi:hypothetical protein
MSATFGEAPREPHSLARLQSLTFRHIPNYEKLTDVFTSDRLAAPMTTALNTEYVEEGEVPARAMMIQAQPRR